MTARALATASLLTTLLVIQFGCQQSEKPLTVTGKVTFQGSPVAEGEIQFIDDRTGKGGQAILTAEGSYTIPLFPGDYKVSITPPYLVDDSSGIPNPRYKKVKNIPLKYHNSETSGLRVEVGPNKTTYDFDMTP